MMKLLQYFLIFFILCLCKSFSPQTRIIDESDDEKNLVIFAKNTSKEEAVFHAKESVKEDFGNYKLLKKYCHQEFYSYIYYQDFFFIKTKTPERYEANTYWSCTIYFQKVKL